MPQRSPQVLDLALEVRSASKKLADLPAEIRPAVHECLRNGGSQMTLRAREKRDEATRKFRFASRRPAIRPVVM